MEKGLEQIEKEVEDRVKEIVKKAGLDLDVFVMGNASRPLIATIEVHQWFHFDLLRSPEPAINRLKKALNIQETENESTKE